MTIIRLLTSNRWAQGLALSLGVAILATVFLLDRCAARIMSSAKDTGRAEQQASDLRETITRTERANNAAETIRRDPDARYAECLRHARNPGDC